MKVTFGIGIPTTLQVNVTGTPSTARKCLSFLSKMGAIHFPVGISSCWTSSSDSSTGVLSNRNSISLISLCSKFDTLYSYKKKTSRCPVYTLSRSSLVYFKAVRKLSEIHNKKNLAVTWTFGIHEHTSVAMVITVSTYLQTCDLCVACCVFDIWVTGTHTCRKA